MQKCKQEVTEVFSLIQKNVENPPSGSSPLQPLYDEFEFRSMTLLTLTYEMHCFAPSIHPSGGRVVSTPNFGAQDSGFESYFVRTH